MFNLHQAWPSRPVHVQGLCSATTAASPFSPRTTESQPSHITKYAAPTEGCFSGTIQSIRPADQYGKECSI